MNILSHGVPFCCDWTPLGLYHGTHVIGRLGIQTESDFKYDPAAIDAPMLFNAIGKSFNPDLAIFWTPEMYPPPHGIEHVGCKTAAIVSDWNVHYATLSHNLARYDVVLCDKPGAEILNRHGIQPQYAMPMYSQISTAHRPLGFDRDIDVLFLGNLNPAAHPARTQILARIAEWQTDAKVVIGSGFDIHEYGTLLNRARIVVNHSIRGELNLRVFETIACGALPMIERSNREVNQYFRDGEDIVIYDPDTIIDTLEHFLAHPDDLDRIAAKAHARAPEWAGENRMDALIDYCIEAPSSGRSFKDFDAETRAVHDWRMVAGARDPAFYPCERAAMDTLAQLMPDSPVAAHAQALAIISPHAPANDRAMHDAAAKAYEAHRRDRNDAIFALNAATLFRAAGKQSMEDRCLRAVLDATGIEGAPYLIGSFDWPTTVRWRRAYAEGRAEIAILHAEAHTRLATIAANNDDTATATDLLNQAEQHDPNNREIWTLRAAITIDPHERAQALQHAIHHDPLNLTLREQYVGLSDKLNRDVKNATETLDRIRSRIA